MSPTTTPTSTAPPAGAAAEPAAAAAAGGAGGATNKRSADALTDDATTSGERGAQPSERDDGDGVEARGGGENGEAEVEAQGQGGDGSPQREQGHKARQAKRVRIDARDAQEEGSNRVDEGPREEREAKSDAEGSGRLPKRKVSIAFGYCGIGYSGLQINPGVKTIEGDVFDAFCKVGAVSKDNAINPTKVGLQRAARTDRGVHAVGNLLTLKLILEPPDVEGGVPGLIKAVNALLPPFIRIWGITRVQNGFNARTSCDSRLYEYLLPTYVFLPPKPGTCMYRMMAKWAGRKDDQSKDAAVAQGGASAKEENGGLPPGGPTASEEAAPRDPKGGAAAAEATSTPYGASDAAQRALLDSLLDHDFWRAHGVDHAYVDDVAAKKRWRMPPQHVERVRLCLQEYRGSHNFHNFTVGKGFKDRSAQRNMKSLTLSDPMIINGTEWVSIKIHGQSFMLHQIRKMVGLLVLIGRTSAPPSIVAETYGPARIHVPKAPGLGLLLQEPFFGGYNDKLARTVSKAKKGGQEVHGATEAVHYEAYAADMERFRQEWIYDRIMKTEEETSEFSKWLNYLDVLVGDDFEFLNPRGVIPPQAVLKSGAEAQRIVDERVARRTASQAKKRKAAGVAAAAAAAAAAAVAAGTLATTRGQTTQEGEAKEGVAEGKAAGEDADADALTGTESEDDDDVVAAGGDAAELEG